MLVVLFVDFFNGMSFEKTTTTLTPMQCCHMSTDIMHPVPDRVKPSFVIFDIRALHSGAKG